MSQPDLFLNALYVWHEVGGAQGYKRYAPSYAIASVFSSLCNDWCIQDIAPQKHSFKFARRSLLHSAVASDHCSAMIYHIPLILEPSVCSHAVIFHF